MTVGRRTDLKSQPPTMLDVAKRAGVSAVTVSQALRDGDAVAAATRRRIAEAVDAAIRVSDLSSFGAIAECQRRNWPVPERIAIAGFCDFEIARCSYPSITTVDVQCHDIGIRAGQLLLSAIDQTRKSKWPLSAL